MWLFGAIGRTVDWNQPVSRYTLDNRYISTETAEVKNETSYNELLVYFPDLDSSYHTLVVENINEGATLFLDYYLVEPMPTEELTKSSGNLQTGGVPMSTSISERPIFIKNTNLSKNAAIGSLVGAVVGGILLAFIIAIVAFVIWRRRGGSKPYYYRRAAVHEVLVDGTHRRSDPITIVVTTLSELKHDNTESRRESVTSTITPYPSSPSITEDTPQNTPQTPARTRTVMSQSSLYSLGSDLNPSSPRQTYFPMPSEYQTQNLLARPKSLAGSKSLQALSNSRPMSDSRSKSLSYSNSLSSRSSGPSLSQEDRPLL